MDVSRCIGRVGLLAVIFGVTSGVVPAIASADSDASPVRDRATRSSSSGAGTAARSAKVPGANSAPTAPAAAATASSGTPLGINTDGGLRRSAVSANKSNYGAASRRNRTFAAVVPESAAAVTVVQTNDGAVARVPSRSADTDPVIPSAASSEAVLPVSAQNVTPAGMDSPAPTPAARAVRVLPRAAAAVPAAATALATSAEPVNAPGDLLFLSLTAVLQLSMALTMSVVNPFPPSPTMVPTPTQNLNGFNIVPSSPKTVTSLYGRWSYTPGGISLVQGEQQFDVVDPAGGDPVGSFDALVSTGMGYNYVELLVQSNDGTNVGTEPGQVPPVGSLISTLKIGRFGWSYSAMPSESGDVLSLKLLTPFGDFPVPISFDAAEGIADHTVDDRPMDLGNGFSIAPTDPAAEILTGVSGILPLFTTVQGHQQFSVYDADGQSVGNFDGVFTTTKDIGGTFTQAILVTGNDGDNVGTAAGQVPPVGSVYNIIYKHSTENYYVYSSLPSPTGTVVSLIHHSAEGELTSITPTLINASEPPSSWPLSAPGGYSFIPVSALQPSGVNGLPPREVEVQGYQQFDVVDAAGNRLGSVDADVTEQWDMFGIQSHVLLITNVTDVAAGVDPGDVPPVGSVFNFVRPGQGGFGTAHSVVPGASGDLVSFKLLTPLGAVVFPSTRIARNDRADVSFFDPFV
ncbi:MAG: hypothetical protein KDB71_10340 [Mycobacterium sp.]|nr:hypothetical protein [Mycobacterium sp.]